MQEGDLARPPPPDSFERKTCVHASFVSIDHLHVLVDVCKHGGFQHPSEYTPAMFSVILHLPVFHGKLKEVTWSSIFKLNTNEKQRHVFHGAKQRGPL